MNPGWREEKKKYTHTHTNQAKPLSFFVFGDLKIELLQIKSFYYYFLMGLAKTMCL
jgi:hypothetical protein